MNPFRAALSALLVALLAPVPAAAATGVPACDELPAAAQATVGELFARLHPYDGCDETFAACLARPAPHPVVRRVAADLCRQVKAGKTAAEVERALARRAQSALPIGAPASIALDPAACAGPADAAVTVTVYACTRCPFCKAFVPALHREVTGGSLAGKARLCFRPFPLKDHEGATEGGLAVLAAGRLGALWPYLLQVYASADRFRVEELPARAAAAGLDQAAFEAAAAAPATRKALVAARQEGLRNRVAATPAVFVDGRRYVHDLTVEAVVDLLLEELERKGVRADGP